MTSCHIQAGHADSPVILHVPHASRSIPDTVRAGILLSNDELQLELDESTDTATDHIAIRAAELLASGARDPGWPSTKFPASSSTQKDSPATTSP